MFKKDLRFRVKGLALRLRGFGAGVAGTSAKCIVLVVLGPPSQLKKILPFEAVAKHAGPSLFKSLHRHFLKKGHSNT